jgi:hypothetical protein
MCGFDKRLANDLIVALRAIDTQPKTIAAADQAQQALLAILLEHNHQGAAFLIVYHGVTVAVDKALAAGHLQPRFFFERLAGKFAERHFDGVKAAIGLDTSSDAAKHQLWAPSFAFALPLPIAHFLVGMSCHINLDLAVALAETIRELGLEDDAETIDEIERGHDFVNEILTDEVEASLTLLARQMACPLSQLILDLNAVSLATHVAMLFIREWRTRTFCDARRLLAATSAAERDAICRDIYRRGASVTTKLLALDRLQPLLLPRRAELRRAGFSRLAPRRSPQERMPRLRRLLARLSS